MTSETMAPMLRMNPVVFRRTMGGLREAGIVESVKGHGGGWSLARELEKITLDDVYGALGVSFLSGIGLHDEEPTCLLEQAVNRAIGHTIEDAEKRIRAHLRSITLADLLGRVDEKARRKIREHQAHQGKGTHTHAKKKKKKKERQ